MTSSRSAAAILGLALVIGLVALGVLLGNAAWRVKTLERTVVVKGLSEREVPADIVIWPVSFQVADNDLNAFFESVAEKNATITAFLEEQGLGRDEWSIAPPVVIDRYAQSYGDNTNIAFRYTGNATVTVYSENVDVVRKAMANVIELGKRGIAISGQNYQSQTQFLFTGLNDLKPQMIEEATRNARLVAQKFAEDSDSRLGKIKSARQGQFSIENRDATTPHIKKVRVVSTVEYYLSD
jgi:hypothetical protein